MVDFYITLEGDRSRDHRFLEGTDYSLQSGEDRGGSHSHMDHSMVEDALGPLLGGVVCSIHAGDHDLFDHEDDNMNGTGHVHDSHFHVSESTLATDVEVDPN